MAIDVATLSAKLVADTSSFTSSMNKAQGVADSSSKGIASKFGFMAKAGVLAGGAIALKFGKDSVSAFIESEKVAAQTNAVLKSTGGIAKVTAGHVGDLASAISKYSGVDDEAVQSGENLLLTFTNIQNKAGKGNKIFDQATRSMTDMSVALGQDMKSSAIQLGKALNDPIKGVTALQRVGVSFTQSQKDQIATLVKSGKQMDAQKLILQELQKEFGGSAKAAGQTFGGQMDKLKVQIGNVQEAIGGFIAKGLLQIPGAIEKVKGYLDAHQAEMEQVKAVVVSVGNTIRDVWQGFILPVIQRVLPAIEQIVKGAFKEIKGAVEILHGAVTLDFSEMWNGVKNLTTGWVTGMIGVIRAASAPYREAAAQAGQAIGHGIASAAGFVKDKVSGVLSAAAGALRIGGTFYEMGQNLISALGHGIGSLAGWLWGKLKDVVGGLKDKALSLLGIHSPSKVFMDIGKNVSLGLGKGILSASGDVSAAVDKGLMGPLNVSPSLTAGVGSAGVSVAPAGSGGAAGGGMNQVNNFYISGGSPQENAREIHETLLALKRRQGALGLA